MTLPTPQEARSRQTAMERLAHVFAVLALIVVFLPLWIALARIWWIMLHDAWTGSL